MAQHWWAKPNSLTSEKENLAEKIVDLTTKLNYCTIELENRTSELKEAAKMEFGLKVLVWAPTVILIILAITLQLIEYSVRFMTYLAMCALKMYYGIWIFIIRLRIKICRPRSN